MNTPAFLLLILMLPLAPALASPLFDKPPEDASQIAPRSSPLPVDRAEPTSAAAPNDLTANQAARQAQAINGGGRVLSVELAKSGWRVKLLRDGNVRNVFVPN